MGGFMMRWVRWSYVLPRLAFLLLLVVASEYGAGILVRWMIESGGEKAIGAKVEVGETSASLFGTYVALREIRVANPHAPMRNLVEADLFELDFESSALLRKKAIADRGLLRGIRFDTARDTSGAIEATAPSDVPVEPSWLSHQASEIASNLWTDLNTGFQEQLVDELESVRLTEELIARWPQTYESLAARVQALKAQASALERTAREARANPLRHAEMLTRMPQELTAFRNSYRELQQEVDRLPAAFDADRRAIIAARRHDEQLIREQLHVDKIDSAALTAYFLRDHVAQPVAELISWIRWSRQLLPAKPEPADPERSRGVDIEFPGCRKMPDLLVRTLELQGTARLGGQPCELSGFARDVTSQPAIHGKPTTLELTTTGSLPITLYAQIDRTGAEARDHLHATCSSIVLPAVTLGKPGKFELAVAPSTGMLTAELKLDGEDLTGELSFVQTNVQMSPAVGSRMAKYHLDETLGQSLRRIDQVTTNISLTGTLDEPAWGLDSNLGPVVATALEQALRRTIEDRADRLAAKTQQRVDERLAQLDRMIAEKQQALLPNLNTADELIKKALGNLPGEGGLSIERLGQQLPTNSLFR